MMRCR